MTDVINFNWKKVSDELPELEKPVFICMDYDDFYCIERGYRSVDDFDEDPDLYLGEWMYGGYNLGYDVRPLKPNDYWCYPPNLPKKVFMTI